MSQLFSQLGIDWHLLLSQAVNFLLLLIALRVFAYGPLMKLLRKRRERIEEGLMKADEAAKRLSEVDEISKKKIKEAEHASLQILKKTELDAKELEEKLAAEAKRRQEVELKNAAAALRVQEESSRRAMEKEAAALVRSAIVKTVELSPDVIDAALLDRAVKESSS